MIGHCTRSAGRSGSVPYEEVVLRTTDSASHAASSSGRRERRETCLGRIPRHRLIPWGFSPLVVVQASSNDGKGDIGGTFEGGREGSKERRAQPQCHSCGGLSSRVNLRPQIWPASASQRCESTKDISAQQGLSDRAAASATALRTGWVVVWRSMLRLGRGEISTLICEGREGGEVCETR